MGLEASLPILVLKRTKQPGLTADLCVLTGLTAEFPQVAKRTSTKIILRANAGQYADWIFYEKYSLNQVFCIIDHLIIQLTYPEFHFETETEVDSLTGLQRLQVLPRK